MSARNIEIVISAFDLNAEDVLDRPSLHLFELAELFKQGFERRAFMFVHWERSHTSRNHRFALDSAHFLEALKRLNAPSVRTLERLTP